MSAIGTGGSCAATCALALALIACGDNHTVDIPIAPQISSGGGPVLAAPEIVPIFFAGDDDIQHQIETFLTALPSSSYWAATTSEYGVGPPTVDTTIVSTETPPTTDDALQAMIEADVAASATSGWPVPNANTLYVVFLPAGVTLSMGPNSVSCMQFGGYHAETTASGLVYALLPRCPTTGAPIDELTTPTSHELIEAATDPHPFTNPAYNVIDQPDLVWQYTPGSELGDMCEYVQAARQRLVGDFQVQRTWSNVSGLAGHDPCVPALPGPYVRAVPVFDDVDLDYGNGDAVTLGIEIPNGESRTVGLELLSDAPSGDWTVGTDDVASVVQGMPAELSASLSKTTGHNGDTIYLTLKRLIVGQGGGSEFVVLSKVDGEVVSLWWGLATD